MKRARWTQGTLAIVLYAFLYLPIAVVILYSFNRARYGSQWDGFTLEWYRSLLQNKEALGYAGNTLVLGLISTALASGLGTLLALGLQRSSFPGQRLFERIQLIPVVIPDIALAVAMMLFYSLVRSWLGLFELGMSTMIIAHITFQIPFVTLIIRARLTGLDPALIEAARDLGATSGQTFRHLTLPLLRPGIAAAAILAFTLSLDDFVVSFFTTGPEATTLPIFIYSSVKRGITPEINALSTLFILVSFLAVAALFLVQRPSAAPVLRDST